MSRFREERQAAVRASPQQRVLAAVMNTRDRIHLDAIKQVAGVTTLEALTALEKLCRDGIVEAMGELWYRMGRHAA